MWLKNLFEKLDFSKAWSRFYLSILSAILIAILFILKTEDLIPFSFLSESVGVRLFYSLSLLYVLGVFFAYNSFRIIPSHLTSSGISVLIAGIYFSILPAFPTETNLIRHFVLLGVVVLAVPLTRFWVADEEKKFWAQIVHSLFLFIETTFFSLFLYVTIALALVAIENLFGIDFSKIAIYADLFIVIALVFHPLYFLSKYIPRDQLKTEFLPNGFIKTFSSRILLGIVLLYASILFVYFLKITINASWPNGWVSNLILSFSVLGILCFGINKFLYETGTGKLIAIYNRWFFPFLLLSCLFLAIAIYIRVEDYGLTEPRYLVVASTVWLFLVSLYFIISKQKDLRSLFISLIVFLIVIFYSPFNLFHLSKVSQSNRLLDKVRSLTSDGSDQKETFTDKDKYEIGQIVQFFDSRHAVHELLPLSQQFANVTFDEYQIRDYSEFLFYFSEYSSFEKGDPLRSITEALGFEPVYSLSTTKLVDDNYYFRSNVNDPLSIDSFKTFIRINYPEESDNTNSVGVSTDGSYLIFAQDSIPVKQVIPNGLRYTNSSEPPIVFDYTTDANSFRLVIRECNWYIAENGYTLSFLKADCFIQ